MPNNLQRYIFRALCSLLKRFNIFAFQPALVPYEIPPPPINFVDREHEIKEILRYLEANTTIVAICGMGGIGKTSLAYKLAEMLQDNFPDGQLMVNLEGTGLKPLTPAEIMAHIIYAYKPKAKLPKSESDLRATYHKTLLNKRALILLDNAADDLQVRPLLPPPSTCGVIITSRKKFTLTSLKEIDLDVLNAKSARDLLLSIDGHIGDSAEDIARLCGYLPLALRSSGSYLRGNPGLKPADYVNKLEETILQIHKNAKEICKTAHQLGTEYEVPGEEIYKAAGGNLSSDKLSSKDISSSIIAMKLKKFCQILPDDERGQVYKIVEKIEHTPDYSEKLQNIALVLSCLEPALKKVTTNLVDIAILTVLPEEYSALSSRLMNLQPPLDMGSNPNLYAWQFGEVPCSKFNCTYKVAIGMTGRPGNNQSALAVKEAIHLWRPRYIIFSGIAGGLPDPKKDYADIKLGYVVIADVVYAYEYMKIDNIIEPRGNWTKNTDQGLLTSASAYAYRELWRNHINVIPPRASNPNAIVGEIASGEKVVDNRTNKFFSLVLNRWPKVKAVEMEGAGVGSAIEQAQSVGIPVGFMVIRGISDLLLVEEGDVKSGGTEIRDAWKAYASDTAAAFTVSWIADGLPLKPST